LGFVALQFFFLGFVAAEQCSTDYEVFMWGLDTSVKEYKLFPTNFAMS
jgi:hypothetical protein